MQKSNFKGYELQLTSQAEKELKKLDKNEAAKIDKLQKTKK
jgi:mRNA-degrading endonuclease RelE of RelBE toxin-antitoxin system